MNEINKLSPKTLDITKKNIEVLKSIFPEVIIDNKIDFDKLKLLLGEEINDDIERYNFSWNGKKKAIKLAQSPTFSTLKPNIKKSKEWKKTKNIYIEGDNLEVLKTLQKSYSNKVKMIYIDPPYNTGKEFVYKDNFRNNLQNYYEQTQQLNQEGEKLKINTESNGRYHTDWLNMMYPRLRLAKNLLKEDGVIFVSIGKDENENLAKILDEIYGEKNRIGIIPVITNLKGNQDAFGFAETHEYVAIYAKDKSKVKFGRLLLNDEELNEWGEDEYGLYKIADNLRATGINSPRSKRPNLWYPIYLDSNDKIYVTEDNHPRDEKDESILPINSEGEELSWYWSKVTLNENKHNLIIKRTKNGTQFYRKQRPSLGNDNPTKKPKSVLFKPEYSSSTATTNLKKLMNGKMFDFPKPVPLIKDFITLGTENDSIILDFFSGSSTTAEAVFRKNLEDKGKRKFILVQLPEITPKSSNAYKAGFLTIPMIAQERISKVGEVLNEEYPSGSKEIDLGYKVFELSKTNLKVWDKEIEDINEQLEYMTSNIKEGTSNLDLVYEIILKNGFNLDVEIEKINYNKAELYILKNELLFIVLGEKIEKEMINIIFEKAKYNFNELSVVLQEELFNKDSEKLNFIKNLEYKGVKKENISFL